MKDVLQSITRRSSSQTFRRSFALILLAEAITILAAWLLLNVNVSRWIHERSAQAVHISKEVAGTDDWSLIDKVPRGRGSGLFERYHGRLKALTLQLFPHNEGDLALILVDRGQEYAIDADDPYPMDNLDRANQWEFEAYASRATAYNPVPYSDSTGTYLAAYTPILRDGKVVGLVEAEYDSATLADFRAIVQQAFWLSVLPAILLSLAVAWVLAGMFVEPMEVFRRISEATALSRSRSRSAGGDPLDRLSRRESEVAELVRQARTNKEIAQALTVTTDTVNEHMKHILEKTGFMNRVELAVRVEARRLLTTWDAKAPA